MLTLADHQNQNSGSTVQVNASAGQNDPRDAPVGEHEGAGGPITPAFSPLSSAPPLNPISEAYAKATARVTAAVHPQVLSALHRRGHLRYPLRMLDKTFAKWWLARVQPFKDVPPEKLAAEREAVECQQDYNRHYAEFLNGAVFPAVDEMVKVLARHGIVHRVSTWGNQLSLRIHLAWRWGELVIMQSHEDAITFEHHIITEGEKRGDDSTEDHTHQYDLRDPLPPPVATTELQFFLSRVAQDLVEPEQEPEIPPGETQGKD